MIKFSSRVLLLLFVSGMNRDLSEDPGYAVGKIPDELIPENHAVIREDNTSFEIISPSNARLSRKFAVTLLDENAGQYAYLVIPYDKNDKIVSLNGTLYDAGGREVNKLKSSDIIDHSAEDGFSLFKDDRMKYASFTPREYPCTIEFEYEITYNGIISYPNWIPVEYENISVQHSQMNVTVPDNITFRYKETSPTDPVTIIPGNHSKLYRWGLENMKSFRNEPFMPPAVEFLPAVYTAPDNFELDNHKGNMSTWKEFGQWVYDLNAGRDSLSGIMRSKIKSLTEGINGQREQIRILYDYLKNTTRYVSVQLGIGGYQSFEASFVESHGYGDCKALTNYMHALLNIIGIPSYMTLVHAGNGTQDIQYDFPSQQFNHAILCVPQNKDTIWLECTSQHNPFGYLGSFTGNRHVLVITGKGGLLTMTPSGNKNMNVQDRFGEVFISAEGKSTARIRTTATGLRYDAVKSLPYADLDTQQKWLYNQIAIPDFKIEKYTFDLDTADQPRITEQLDLVLDRYVIVTGSRLFCQLNLMNQVVYTSAVDEKRTFDMVFDYPYIDQDSIIYHVPAGYAPEYIPEPTEIRSQFGSYSTESSFKEGEIVFTRKLEREKGRFSKDYYPEYRDFIHKIISSDRKKIVLVKSG